MSYESQSGILNDEASNIKRKSLFLNETMLREQPRFLSNVPFDGRVFGKGDLSDTLS